MTSTSKHASAMRALEGLRFHAAKPMLPPGGSVEFTKGFISYYYGNGGSVFRVVFFNESERVHSADLRFPDEFDQREWIFEAPHNSHTDN
jgi:hypothetical protein